MDAWIYKDGVPRAWDGLIYLDPRSINAAEVIQKLHANGKRYGIYYSPGWDSWPGPLAAARTASKHLSRLGLNGSDQPIMFDLETTNVAWVRRFLAAWRTLRPFRKTAYTNAPFQGGYVPSLALRLARVDVYIQTYYGDMRPADGAAALLEIARQGTPPARLFPFYDGAHIPADARDGCVFTLERIPV